MKTASAGSAGAVTLVGAQRPASARQREQASGVVDFFTLDGLEMRYDPFPIGAARPIIEPGLYRELVDRFPPLDAFVSFPKVGYKYVLSKKFNTAKYDAITSSDPMWRSFRAWIESPRFVAMVMDGLRAQGVDLGYTPEAPGLRSFLKRARKAAQRNQKPSALRLSSRFEFSMLPADGGFVRPHTDIPSKIVTLIISMVADDEWDPRFGGGTDVNWPKDPRWIFNQQGDRRPFEDMDVVDTYPYLPNQAVVFVKTFNSWHSVPPMTGAGSPAMRRTLTINIEAR